ncbi:phosphotransferase [Amycolatopsis sp. RTGN1]|uniref:phosphotransferase n=1 Tax=Amycolatopsis ponsaeliensis TaxID=2992142 RepID=UPI00254C5F79|nr:phosphotransferase [Amycolatopsis sp. RTGN1]
MPVPMKVRGPRPPAVSTAVTSVVPPRRPETRGALEPGPADVVRAQTLVGNAAVSAVMGGLPRGKEPNPGSWAARQLMTGQQLVGNQAVASRGLPAPPVRQAPVPAGKKPPAPVAPKAKPATADPKAEPDKSTVESPDKRAPKEKAAGPRSPGADPKFQALKKDVATKKKAVGSSHPPATAEAGSAQAAAVAPADDQEARGKAAHAEDMDAAQPKEFDKKAFVDAVQKAVADKAPKNLDEADKFGKSDKAGQIKTEVQDKVGEGKDASAREIADTTAAPPEPAPDAKQVVPMTPDRVPAKPGTPNPAQAAPDTLPPSATDMSAGPAQVDGQLAAANVTEQQLTFENSREPGFDKAVRDKKAMDAHSETAPKKLRAGEHREVGEVKAGAAARGSATMAGIQATRVATGKLVGTKKTGTKKTDEDKRKEVTDLLQKVFDRTKGDVERILTDLDKKVDDEFTTKEKRARDRFTREHEDGMNRYKDERYGGWDGWIKWGRDLFAGLPDEANRIYEVAKDHYLTAMGLIITDIADLVERELRRAKDRIATGRGELQAAVDALPADLKAIGREAAGDFAAQFDDLKDTVDDKGTELVDTLATKYTDAVKAVDGEIAAEKEKNKGLVAKAADAIGGAIKAIVELGRMLMGVLAKAVSAIGAILKDPIGFLGNLVTGVGGGLKLFIRNAGKHLEQGVLAWLLGTAATAGLQLPTTFDIAGILVLIATLLGISWPNIRSRLVRKVPEKAVAAAEVSVPMLAQVKRRGILGVVDDVKTRVGDLKKTLIDDLVSYLLPTIIIAGITWILSLFNPASAFIRACKMIIDIVRFVVLNARQIIDFVNAVLDAVLAIARGGTGGVPALVERALARAVPVLIGALAALLGIGGIAGKVRQIFQKLSRPVTRAVDWVIDKIAGLVKKLWAKLKPKARRPVRGRPDDHLPAGPRRPRPAGRPRPPRRRDPRREKKDDAKLRRKLMAALHEAGRLADRVSGDQDAVRRGLPAIKSRHRLTMLTVATRPGTGDAVLFVFDGAINPRAKFEHLANDHYFSEARKAYKRPDPAHSLDFAIDDMPGLMGGTVPGLKKVLGLGESQARKYAEKWVSDGKLTRKVTARGRVVYSFVHLTDVHLRVPFDHPERDKWMAGAATIHLSSATAARLWYLVIAGLRDGRPDYFEVVAEALMHSMRIAPGKGALWSKGEDISEYAAGLGFAALETQEFYNVTKGLTLLDDWALVRPLWMVFSRRYAGSLRKEIHIFVRQFLASSVLLETELPTVRRIMRSTRRTIELKFHAMDWGDDPTKILDMPVPGYFRELMADGTALPEGRQHVLDEKGARAATARARGRFRTSQANKRAAGTRTPTGGVDPAALDRLMSSLPVVPTAGDALARFAALSVNAPGEVRLVAVGGGFSGAPVRRILDASGRLLGVLKLFPSREEFAMELSALARLGRVRIVGGRAVAALGVARTSRRRTAAGLVVTSAAGGRDVEGMMKETGATPSGPERRRLFGQLKAAVAGIGRTLAQLHTRPGGSGGPVASAYLRRHLDDMADRRTKLTGLRTQLAHAGIDVSALQARIDTLIAGFRAHPGGAALVHGDAHPGNYFFDPASGVTTIIDVTTLHLSIDARGNPIGAPSRDVGVFAQQVAHYSVTLKLTRAEVATLQSVFRRAYAAVGATGTTPQADAFFRARASLGWLMRVMNDLRAGTVRGVVPPIDAVQQQHIDLAVEAFGL